MIHTYWIMSAVAFWLTQLAGIGLYMRYARTLDVPSERSNHQHPIIRGAGIVLGTFCLAGLLAAVCFYSEVPDYTRWLIPGGMAMMLLGYGDDVLSLPAAGRFVVQTVTVGMTLFAMQSVWPTLWYGLSNPWFIPAWWIAGIWCINQFNFMDGSDGFAGSEAMMLFAWGALLFFQADAWFEMMGSVAVSLSCLAYLCWNFPPARVFMGDSGSYFLGYMLLSAMLIAQCYYEIPIFLWLIPHAFFCVDAPLTLIRRAIQGEPWMQAHTQHAFQRLLASGWSHKRLLITKWVAQLPLWGVAYIGYQTPEHLILLALGAWLYAVILYAIIECVNPMKKNKITNSGS